MYIILFRNKISTGPADTWQQLNNSLYFNRKRAKEDCQKLNDMNVGYMYTVCGLTVVK